jgi:type II secretion system protein H
MMKPRVAHAFTLVELIVVMALLAMVLALSAPSLGRSMRERGLADEAARFLAATEYARNEAVSQGVPMIVWLDPQGQGFGVEPRAGFDGDAARAKDFAAHPDVTFVSNATRRMGGVIVAAEFSPEGTLLPTSVGEIQVQDRFQNQITLAQTEDGWGYEIVTEAR